MTAPSGSGSLLVERDGPVVVLSINRPERLNALTAELIDDLVMQLQVLGADDSVGVVVLTGKGRAFCTGGDRLEMASRLLTETTADQMIDGLAHRARVVGVLRSVPQPTIAVLNGPAVGAGLSLACAADFRVASTRATLSTIFTDIGLSGDYGISWTLPRLVGEARARRLLMLAEHLNADEALEIGLVDEVAEHDDLETKWRLLADKLASRPRGALRAIQDNLNDSRSMDFKTLIAIESRRQAQCAEHSLAVSLATPKRST